MESGSKNNSNYIFYEEFDDKVKAYPEGRYYSTNNTSFYGKRGNSSSDEGLDENSNNLFKMKLRSTVADSKFIEQSSTNSKSKMKRDNSHSETYRPEDIFDLTFNDGNYSTNVDSDSKGFDDRSFTNMGSFEKKMNRYSTNVSFESDIYKEEDMGFEVDPFIEQGNVNYNVFHEGKVVSSRSHKHTSSDLASSLRDIANKIEFNEFKNNSRKSKYEDRIAYMTNKITNLKSERDICSKNLHMAIKETEIIKSKLESRIIELESHVRQLTSMITQNGNDLLSDSCVERGYGDPDFVVGNDNTSNTTGNNTSTSSSTNVGVINATSSRSVSNVCSTTLPSITIEYSDLDEKSRNFVNKLMKYLYADINDSESSMFMPNLYKSLREMPRVVECRSLVNYILDCISRDSEIIHSKLSRSIILSEDDMYTESPLGVPQSNIERQVVSELESTLQVSTGPDPNDFLSRHQQGDGMGIGYSATTMRNTVPVPGTGTGTVNASASASVPLSGSKFRSQQDGFQSHMGSGNFVNINMNKSTNFSKMMSDEFSYLKTHLIMNRGVLLAIFKSSHMNNLYNYLFEALKSDNFRVVEILNQAVCSKFMDFMMGGSFVSKVRHPIIWAFGPKFNGNQAYRYIKMVNYNFSRMPTDPTTGDNLWHMVARGNGVLLAQKLKAFSVYTPHLNSLNNDGKTPLSISSPLIKREFYVNLIVDLASKGSEMYKKNCYDKALEHYTDAIQLQSQLMSDQIVDTRRQVASSSRDNSPRTKEYPGSSRDSKGNRIGGKYSYNDAFASSVESRNDRRDYNKEDFMDSKDLRERESKSNRENYDLNMGKLYYNKARTLMHLDRWMEAIEYCELCLKHIPNYNNAYDTCIRAYENLLDWNNAATTCIAMKDSCGMVDDARYQFIVDQRDATYFQLLDLDSNATPVDIKKAFNSMCKIWHPDKIAQNLPEDIKKRCINHFNRLFEAREKLMDPGTRALQQIKRVTKYKIPTPFLNQEKQTEDFKDSKDSRDNRDKENREIYKESSFEMEFKEFKEKSKCVPQQESENGNMKKTPKVIDPKDIKSRDNLNELMNERLKFMDSMNLLKGQATFDYDSFSWGQL